jgi:hypothetical protein
MMTLSLSLSLSLSASKQYTHEIFKIKSINRCERLDKTELVFKIERKV